MKIDKKIAESNIGVIAIHGGPGIEPGTDTCAKFIAGDDLGYCVVVNDNSDEHITSTKYRQPEVVDFVQNHDVIISVHGEKTWDESFVLVGGLNKELKQAIARAITAAGYDAQTDNHKFPAVDPANICNMGRSGAGVQLEMSRGLRHFFWKNEQKHQEFADAIRAALDH